MAENTKNSSSSSGTGPVPSKRYPSPSSDSDSKRICLHDSRESTPTISKASQNSTKDVTEEIIRTADQELLSNVAQPSKQGINQIAPLPVDETTLHKASPRIDQEASQVDTEQPTLEAVPNKTNTLVQETAHEACKLTLKEGLQEISQEIPNAIIEEFTPEVAQKVPMSAAENTITKITSNDIQSISGKTDIGSPQEFSQSVTEQITTKVEKSNVQILSQEIIQEASEIPTEDVSQEAPKLVTEKNILQISQEAFQGAKEELLLEVSQEIVQINVEESVHEDNQEVTQVPVKGKSREISRSTSPATFEEVTPVVMLNDIQSFSQEPAQENAQSGTEDTILEVPQEPPQTITEQSRPDIGKSENQGLSQANTQEDSQVNTENQIHEDAQQDPQLNTGDIVREASKESSQLLAKDKLKETTRDTSNTEIEGKTSVLVSGDTQGISRKTVQEDTQIPTQEIKSGTSHTDIPIVSDSKPSEARRKSRVVEEKKRGQRLFGGLLSTLSQSSPNGQQRRRLEIEKRQLERAKIRKVQDNVNKAERIAKLNAARIKEQSKFKKESFHVQKANVLAMANFLCTKTEPKLYYKPWELLPEQEEKVKSQIASAAAKFKGSGSSEDGNDQVGLKDGEKLNESSKEIVGEPHTEPPNIAVDADAHNAFTSLTSSNTNDVADSLNKDSKVEEREREREREEHNCEVMVENEEDTVIY